MPTINILFIGDIVGKPGIDLVQTWLPGLIQKYKADFVIANAENVADGKGCTEKEGNQLFDLGVHVLTGGNHTWDKHLSQEYLRKEPKALRPLNYPKGTYGNGYDSQLSVRLARPFVVRGSYVRDVRFSLWYNNPYYVESRPGVGASLSPVRFLRFDYDYFVGRNRYPLVGGGGPEEKRLDDFTVQSAGMYVRIRKTAALGFIASWWVRNSNLDEEDDKRTFFGANLTYDF